MMPLLGMLAHGWQFELTAAAVSHNKWTIAVRGAFLRILFSAPNF
jgi:hypothetical protein